MSNCLHEHTVATFLPLLAPASPRFHNVSETPDQWRPSQVTTSSSSHAHTLENSDPGVPSQPPVPTTSTGFGSPYRGSSYWEDERLISADTLFPTSSATRKHASVREKHAYERTRFMKAQGAWMTAMMEVYPKIKPQLEHEQGFSRMEETWRESQDIAPRLHSYDHELNGLDTVLGPSHTFMQVDYPCSSAAPHTSPSLEKPYPDIVVDIPHEDDTGSTAPDYADLYYQHASAVRYLSDDLINLGPRPSGDDTTTHFGGQEGNESADQSPDALTYYEYAERHLHILKDLAVERAEAAKYKKLCLENNIKLDEDTEGDADSQSEDVYQSLLNELEYGAPRIDSMVALNQGQQHYPSGIAIPVAGSTQTSRIAEWATSVASQSGKLINEPAQSTELAAGPAWTVTEYTKALSTINDIDNRAREWGFSTERPSRRRSASQILQGTTVSPTTERRHRETCPNPVRSDSGVQF